MKVRDKNKINLGDFNCTMNKIDRHAGDKPQRFYRCGFNYALSNLIVDNRLEGLCTMRNPDSSEFTRYNRSSGTISAIGKVYTDIKIANKTKINHIMVSLMITAMLFLEN